jgi:RNA polymerase sigma factor (sigma-70 family)
MKTSPNGRISTRLATATCVALMAAAVGGGSVEAQTVQQLERYLTTSWRNAQIAQQDWSDCTQQAMTELLERLPRTRFTRIFDHPQMDDRRELNRAVWRTVQRWRRRRKCASFQPEYCGIAHPASTPTETIQRGEARDELDKAMASLSDRQQQILRLWSQGHAVAEIAKQLDLPPARVSDEKYKAVRKLRHLMGIEATQEMASA